MQTCTAIILRAKEFGETDLLVTFFTPEKGQQKGVAKGARRSRKRFVNCLDLFSLVRLEYRLPGKGDLWFLTAGKLENAFPGLRSDYNLLTRASYMIELTETLFPLGVAAEEMFTLLHDALLALEGGGDRDLVSIIFETRALCLGGYGIQFLRCCSCGRTYKGEGTAVYTREKGGICCLKCARPSNHTPPMGPEAAQAMADMQSGRISLAEPPELPGEVSSEIRSVLNIHREYHLGWKPKARWYLE